MKRLVASLLQSGVILMLSNHISVMIDRGICVFRTQLRIILGVGTIIHRLKGFTLLILNPTLKFIQLILWLTCVDVYKRYKNGKLLGEASNLRSMVS